MTSPWRFGALMVAVALLGACSGGGDDDSKKVSASDDDTTTTSTASELGLDGSTSELETGAVTTAEGATATTRRGAAATTAKPGSASGATGGGTAPPAAPAKVGTYTYSQSGSTPDGPVPPTGTLVVDGGGPQTFNRYYDPNKAPQRLTYVFRDNGAFINGATMNFRGATANCTFGNGVPAPPWPPTPGSTFNGSGSCTTPIGPMTASIASTVTSRAGDIVNLSTTVNVKNSSGSVDVTLQDAEGWSVALRVPKTSRQTFSGTAFNRPVNGDVSSTLTGSP